MIPNIMRGGDIAGLVRYLFGPGRANEHTNQHIVAGSEDIAAEWAYGGRVLEQEEKRVVAKLLDQNRLEHGTQILGEVTRWDYEAERAVPVSKEKTPAHVWHCSLSLHPDEEPLSDETWAAIARDFIEGMEFDNRATTSKSPCQWIAVRHGFTKAGGDHIHIALVLVREDGTKANTWLDYKRSQKLCTALEEKYGLAVLESRKHNYASRGYKNGDNKELRLDLETAMRLAAGAASTESEYVEGLTRHGIEFRPRYAKGQGVVAYTVTKQEPGKRAIWIGGGRVARDLTLTRLRARWDDNPEERRKAADLWNPLKDPAPHTAAQACSLEEKIKTIAASVANESDFAQHLRASGLLVSVRLNDEASEAVSYSVATKPESGHKPTWYSMNRMSADVSLNALREHWWDNTLTRSSAVAIWKPAARTSDVDEARVWSEFGKTLTATITDIEHTDASDCVAIADTCGRASALFAGLANAYGPEHGRPFARASQVLGRRAQTKRAPTPRRYSPVFTSGLRALSSLARPRSRATWVSSQVMDSMERIVTGITRIQAAHGELTTARRTLKETQAALATLTAPEPRTDIGAWLPGVEYDPVDWSYVTRSDRSETHRVRGDSAQGFGEAPGLGEGS
ncbi:relaxase/mobilization nuclease domain-containing protein [Actinotignum schaalii]|uniref:relaxase/mobilization nuclease domain-containing protein n=1 Tax=Actinotignum TaxID=1653174 RepID=UPI00237E0A0E|nr:MULTISPECIES: relaxase/mobilization nuclease domain-containing protein [Actinotignum]MDE1576993.1 relaxase/mobilization nuclease domain-containing protein [Actinotignum sanguinis]MDE1653913.1 relaxase/mobilization nuclease domain-containing protein [Actinotignum schaalii]